MPGSNDGRVRMDGRNGEEKEKGFDDVGCRTLTPPISLIGPVVTFGVLQGSIG